MREKRERNESSVLLSLLKQRKKEKKKKGKGEKGGKSYLFYLFRKRNLHSCSLQVLVSSWFVKLWRNLISTGAAADLAKEAHAANNCLL